MKNLCDAKNGRSYQISGLDNSLSFKVKRRLCDLGIIAGQEVTLVRRSVLGKAYLLEIRGYTLSLRKSVARGVLIN